jgi:hypothetical protein
MTDCKIKKRVWLGFYEGVISVYTHGKHPDTVPVTLTATLVGDKIEGVSVTMGHGDE